MNGNKILLAISVIILLSILSVHIVEAISNPLTYSKSYPLGYSTKNGLPDNPNDPEEIISVRPIINNTESSIKLDYYIVNSTLVINQINIRNVTIYYDRAINAIGNGDFDYYLSLIPKELNIIVKGTKGQKNITIKNCPKPVSAIVKDGESLDFKTSGNDVSITINPTGEYNIYFSPINITGGADSLDTDDISENQQQFCFWLFILSIIIIVYCIHKRFR